MSFARADAAPVTDGSLYASSIGHAIDGGYRRPGARRVGAAAAVAGIAALGWWALKARRAA